ncbi:MAG: type II secretion system F family protein [Bdellovibrionales bacterium]|nr:type II secretion system F family protein [Bdellovibrionales bacterium]
MSFIINNSLVLYLVFFATGFMMCYLNFDRLSKFFQNNTLGTQEEILNLMDKLLISQNKEKFKKNTWIISILLSGLGFVLTWPNLLIGFFVGSLLFVGVWWLIKKYLQILWKNHCNRVVSELVEALTIMCNSIKVGLSLGQSIERVVKGFPGALSKEFNLVLNKTKLGQNLEEALEEMAGRVERTEINMLVNTTNILKETGGNLGETFFVMSETIRERQKMEKKIKSLTAQGIMQAKIISSLPFLLIGVFFIIDQNYISPLFTNPIGLLCLVIVCILVCIGWFSMKKIVSIKV